MDHHYHYYTNGISHRREVVTPTLMIPENWIDRILPKELLLKILSYLDIVSLCRCARVSKYWNQSALDGSNWQTVDLFFFQTDVEGPVIENLSRRCGGFLKILSLRGCQSVTDASLRQFAMNCQNIISLNLNGCTRIADGTCQSLSQYCHRLTKLDLESCSNITDTSLITVSAGCTNLISICISWCNRATDEGLHHLLRKCSKLQTFIAKGCPQLTCIGFKHLGFCPELRTINLHGCMNMTDMTITKISEGCPNLTSLCISKCSRLTDASLIHLSQGCHELRTLEVASCVQFSDNGFQALAKNCHNLQRLDLEECIAITDATVGHLALNCPRLSELTLSHCENITDEGIGQLGGSLCAAETLTVVELDNCPLVSDVSLLHLHGCQNLQRIELYDCQLVTRGGIHKLKCHLPNIKVHAYFAPATPPPSVGAGRRRLCRCCVIL